MLQHIEYGYYDFASDEKETLENITRAIKYSPSIISVLPQYLKFIKKNIPDHIQIGCVIDYPFGLSGSLEREQSVKSAIKQGAKSIEIVCPNHALCNRKYDRFRLEIDCIKKTCMDNRVDLKYIMEYKTFTLNLLYKISEILYLKKLPSMYPSTSFYLDSISDNILVSMMLKKKNPNTNIIISGQAWTNDHIDLILSNDQISSYKTTNIYTLEKIANKILQN